MSVNYWAKTVVLSVGVVCLSMSRLHADMHDFDGTGYVDLADYRILEICLSLSGPGGNSIFDECAAVFDGDIDTDIDLADFGRFQSSLGHLPIPLRDFTGAVITLGSDTPYHGPATCGSCHDVDRISNGFIHQQGRTDADANIIMTEDFFGDGRPWVRSAGMYGRWSGGGGGLNRQTSGKHNASESEMDMTAFYWASNCGGCHAGGGGTEFDRDGQRLWDEQAQAFGYEFLGETLGTIGLDGDYVVLDDSDGSVSAARWDITGVASPECLHCHRFNRTWDNGQDMHREWRAAVLGAADTMVDSQGVSVPAFASAGTAGQGWFSLLDTESNPPVLQIDYAKAVAGGDVQVNESNELLLGKDFLSRPVDRTCWGCHLPGGFQNKRGSVWFDERDVHYRKLTNRSDDDPRNDISDARATTCKFCHPGTLDHNFAKGDSPYARFRNELDWQDFRSCRECHLWDSPVRHPDAPIVLGGQDNVAVHLARGEHTGPLDRLACQACHVPYALARGVIATDRSLTGTAVFYYTDELLSADPLNPGDPDKSTWHPTLVEKVDSDGKPRFFPQKTEVAIYWADWDQNGTPGDLSDDTVRPIILWRVRQITGDQPLGVVTDDTGDGKLEVNRPAEMLAYIEALKGLDSYGRAVAVRPVLVKGDRVWYADPEAPEGVAWFDPADSGAYIEAFEVFGLDHNVLAASEAWGASEDGLAEGCDTCHISPSPVFDRPVLIDPFDENGDPVYRTVRALTGLSPP